MLVFLLSNNHVRPDHFERPPYFLERKLAHTPAAAVRESLKVVRLENSPHSVAVDLNGINFYCKDSMWYFIGLGNPNEEYKTTRHNVGMNAVAFFFEKEGCTWREKDSFFESDVMKISKDGNDIIGLLPHTFMNASGRVARAIVKRGGGAMNIVVVHDDLDLPFGEVRISFNRGSGGHNGVSSINDELGTPEYLRVRIGIAHVDESGIVRKPDGHDAVDHYVLGNFNPKETEMLSTTVYPRVVTILSTILEKGYISAMNEYN